MFSYYTVYVRYLTAPLLQKSERMLHDSTVWARDGRFLWVHSLTRTDFLPSMFWSISCCIDHDMSRTYSIYISIINVSHICYVMSACVIYISKYLHDVIFCETYFRSFLQTKSGVVMGPALWSLVAPQFVITTTGAARGGRVGFVAALDFQCSVICLSA